MRKFSEEHKRKISLALKGRKLTIEHKKNVSLGQKGRIGYWTGKKRIFSKKHCDRISVAMTGKKHTLEHKKISSECRKGVKLSEEHKKNIGLGNLGRVGYWKGKKFSAEHIEKARVSLTGQKRSRETVDKFTGKNNYRWIEDRSLLKIGQDRPYDTQYKYWMLKVKGRDNWKCKISNKDCSGRLEAHHILSWKNHPELRYDINNGITLCHSHHPIKRSEAKQLISTFQELLVINK